MMTEQRAPQAALLYPSAIEAIAADYPQWEISRTREGAVHGDWVAERDGVRVSADSAAGLLVRLGDQELSRLQAEHGDRYRIRRHGNLWMATPHHAGTPLVRDTSQGLEEAMGEHDQAGAYG